MNTLRKISILLLVVGYLLTDNTQYTDLGIIFLIISAFLVVINLTIKTIGEQNEEELYVPLILRNESTKELEINRD